MGQQFVIGGAFDRKMRSVAQFMKAFVRLDFLEDTKAEIGRRPFIGARMHQK